jgi:O-antigen ligase
MATAWMAEMDVGHRDCVPLDDRHGWGYALLLSTTATLFLRPADLVPAMKDWPIYQFFIIACLIVSTRAILRQLADKQLGKQPVTACLCVLFLAIGASHLSHGFLWGARTSMVEFAKIVAFYFLMVGLINTPKRLYTFIKLLTIAISTIAALALLDRYEIVTLAAIESIQDRESANLDNIVRIERLRGTGIFQDPNDLGLILVTGLILCCGFLFRPAAGWLRYLWVLPGGVLLSALALTYSRGALLSLSIAIPAAVAYRRGIGGLFLSLLALPVLGLVFAGRMTDISALNSGTGQTRIQIWSDSLSVWRQYPLFGVGEGLLVEEIGVVAHNSFIQTFAELGVVGGTAFTACFLAAGLGLWKLRKRTSTQHALANDQSTSGELRHLQVFIFATLAAYAFGMLALSRQFVTPTYLILGLSTATQLVIVDEKTPFNLDVRFLVTATIIAAGSLGSFYLAVRLFVHW